MARSRDINTTKKETLHPPLILITRLIMITNCDAFALFCYLVVGITLCCRINGFVAHVVYFGIWDAWRAHTSPIVCDTVSGRLRVYVRGLE